MTTKNTANAPICKGMVHGHGVWNRSLASFLVEATYTEGDTEGFALEALEAYQSRPGGRGAAARDAYSVQPLYLQYGKAWRCQV